MANYKIIAKNIKGKVIKGYIQANSLEHLYEILKKQNIFLIKVVDKERWFFNGIDKLLLEQQLIFTKQINILLQSGLTIKEALFFLGDHFTVGKFSKIIKELKEMLDNNKPLYIACSKYNYVFDPVYLEVLRNGEQRLDKAFKYIGEYLENNIKLNQQLDKLVKYPIIIMLLFIFTILFLLVIIVPYFSQLYVFNSMPILTLILFKISNFIINSWQIIFLPITLFVLLLNSYLNVSSYKIFIDKLLINLPYCGELFNKVVVFRFINSLNCLLNSNYIISNKSLLNNNEALKRALDISIAMSNNMVFTNLLLQVRLQVNNNGSLATGLSTANIISPLTIHLLRMGESSNSLEEVLTKLTVFYYQDIEFIANYFYKRVVVIAITVFIILLTIIIISLSLPIFNGIFIDIFNGVYLHD